jgi:molybdopterin converting factor small subunit
VEINEPDSENATESVKHGYGRFMAALLLFAQAREAAGTKSAQIDGATVGDVLDPAEPTDVVKATDEVAVLPPVSGG